MEDDDDDELAAGLESSDEHADLDEHGGEAGEKPVGEGIEDSLEEREFAAISHLLKYRLPKI